MSKLLSGIFIEDAPGIRLFNQETESGQIVGRDYGEQKVTLLVQSYSQKFYGGF